MDVVKRYVENAGGSIQISSVTGQGSKFKITMRKSITTQIIDGLSFLLNDTYYVIPLKYVVESFPPTPQKFCSVYDSVEHIKRHGVIIPVLRLRELFNPKASHSRPQDKGILIVIDYNGKRLALLVDKIVNIQQVVLKKLKGLQLHKDIFCGGALRGDGYISLILDVEYILNNTSLMLEAKTPN